MPLDTGTFSACQGVGMLIGAIALSALSDRVRPARLLWGSSLVIGANLIVFSRLSSVPPALVLMVVLGLAVSALQIGVGPMVVRATPREYLGRVSALLNPSISLASTISAAVAGWLVSTWLLGWHASLLGQRFGPIDVVFAGSGVLVVAAGLLAFLRLPRHIPVSLPAAAPVPMPTAERS